MAIIGMIAAGALSGSGSSSSKSSSGGGSFHASAGWTVDRVASLSVKIETDDGLSSSGADCAMKKIVGDTTWLEWTSLSNFGQLALIRSAEQGC